MARRMAGTDSAFTIGMRVGQEIGGAIAKTAVVLEDRADKKAAEQAQQEFNQAHEAIKAPWNEVQERARTVAKTYADQGQDIPPEEAKALQQEIRTAKMDYLTNKVDLAMTAMGKDPSNKYIQEQFKGIVDGTLTQLTVTNQRAQQEHQQQMEEHALAREGVEDARYTESVAHRTQREGVADTQWEQERKDRMARAQLRAGADKTRPLDVNEILSTTELFKAEGDKQPPEYWTAILKSEGLEENPENLANVKGMWLFDQVQAKLKADGYSDEQLAAMPHPVNYAVPPDADEAYLNDLKADVEAWRKTGDPKYARRIAFNESLIADAEKNLAQKREEENLPPEVRRANANFGVNSERGFRGWWTGVQEAVEAAPGEISLGGMSDLSGKGYAGRSAERKRAASLAAPKGSAPEAVSEAEEAAENTPSDTEFPTWQGKKTRRGTGKDKWKLITDDGEVPPEVEAQMLQDYHDRGIVAPWMKTR